MSIDEIIEHLIKNKINFSEISSFSKLPGIYAVFFCGKIFPLENVNPPKDEIIYLGKTESSQEKRDAKTHFKSGKTGSSTLRKTFGSLLRIKHKLKPIPRNNSDYFKKRLSHFKFDDKSERIITEWMQNNLALSFFEYSKGKSEIEKLETSLIQKLIPILNIDYKNPTNPFYSLLKQIRKESAKLAFKDFEIIGKNKPIEKIKVNKMSTGSKNLYNDLWSGYINQIHSKLIKSNESQTIALDGKKFKEAGDRKLFSFNLEYRNGIVSNNTDGSAVARDLNSIISKSEPIKSILENGHYKINLDKNFVLHIKKL
jgi:hypothetical protein